MYKVINGKRYDTATAQKLGEKDYYDNSNWLSTQALHRKKTGEYFLAVTGNGSQIYAPKDHIKPLSLAEAKEWGEQHLDGEEYEKIFGEIEEAPVDEPVQLFSILIPVSILDKMKSRKVAAGVSISAQIIKALQAAGY